MLDPKETFLLKTLDFSKVTSDVFDYCLVPKKKAVKMQFKIRWNN